MRTADGIVVEVRDTGIGIAEDKLETVFERFSRSATDRRGVGLGLYIEVHRGSARRQDLGEQVGRGHVRSASRSADGR
jgi:K+-sensing histidine kinase KdpD